MSMFNVAVWVKGHPTPFILNYKTYHAAEVSYGGLRAAMNGDGERFWERVDDYGHTVVIDVSGVAVAYLADVGRELDAKGEIDLMQHRAGLATQARAQTQASLGGINRGLPMA